VRKTFLIAWETYALATWWSPWFLIIYVVLPLFYLIFWGGLIAVIAFAFDGDRRPLGYVDLAGIVFAPAASPANSFELLPFATEAEAERALRAGDIQAYYVVPPDYLAEGEVREFSVRGANVSAQTRVRDFLREQLLRYASPDRRARILAGGAVFHRTLTAQDYLAQYALKMGLAWGMVLALYFSVSLNSAILMGAFADEHSNRWAEIMLSSVGVEQWLWGKLLGQLALGLTPLLIWGGVGALSILWALPLLQPYGIELDFVFPLPVLLLCLALFIPAYLMSALVIMLIGASIGLTGSGMRLMGALVSGVPSLVWLPAVALASQSPSATITQALSLLPFTAPIVLPLRFVQVVVPAWEMILSLGGLYLSLFLLLRYSARLYRAWWLMAGQAHKWRFLWAALRGQ